MDAAISAAAVQAGQTAMLSWSSNIRRIKKKISKELARAVLEQIREKGYAAGFGGEVLCVGLGHCGKRVEIAWEVRKEVCRGTKDV